MDTNSLLQISIVVGIVGTIVGSLIGVFVIAKYFLIIEKRLTKIEKFIGKTNNLNRNK
jgi:cytosine/uracil/thiamine/allantoin permease